MGTYIIAEAGVNHNGDINLAKKLIDIAKQSNVNAVKFQTYKTELIVSKYASKAKYQVENTGNNESQSEMLKKLELSFHQFYDLKKYCESCEIEFLSTPFDNESADFLIDELGMETVKIPSGEITNGPFLLHLAKKRKKYIISTGMSNIGEIEEMLGVMAFGLLNTQVQPSRTAFKSAYYSPEGQALLKEHVMLLHCTTEYPAPVNEINLLAINSLKMAFDLGVGYSDHTNGISIPIAAAALGAKVIEKHITYDKNAEGPDHKASLSPEELNLMVKGIREVELALGNSKKIPSPSEIKNIQVARKSIVAKKAIKSGEHYSEENLIIKRPGTGISPMKYWDLLGKEAEVDYSQDEEIK